MIAGFEQPSEGRILLDGTDVAYTPAHKRNVNTVFQNYALFPHLDVFDNVAFGLRRAKRPKREVRQRALQALELVQLGGLDKRKPSQLSGGQTHLRNVKVVELKHRADGTIETIDPYVE